MKTEEAIITATSGSKGKKAAKDKAYATRHFSSLVSTNNALPTSSEEVNTDLTAYVVAKVVDALFDQIANEEATSDLIRWPERRTF